MKRIVSFILSLILIVSAVPLPVPAVTTELEKIILSNVSGEQGDLIADGYHWNGDTDILELQGNKLANADLGLTGKTTIILHGDAQIGNIDLNISKNGYDYVDRADLKFSSVEGKSYTLKITSECLNFSGGGKIEVAKKTTLITNHIRLSSSGGRDGSIVVNGTWILGGPPLMEGDSQMYCSNLQIGEEGILEASSGWGVQLSYAPSDPKPDRKSVV